ncbi:MAG: hypothetical protein IKZ87_07115 [Actinomycetaceae bacterium]|nr:hypothetical protein [Actinomycetaceae bacterium]
MNRLAQILYVPFIGILTLYIFMHDKGIPWWLYAGGFVVLVLATLVWEKVLPPASNSDERKKIAIRWANVFAVILLVGIAVFVSL